MTDKTQTPSRPAQIVCGGRIGSVEKGSPAEKAGLQAGDVVTAINGIPVADTIDYLYLTAEKSVEVRYLRGGAEKTAVVTKPEEAPLGIGFADTLFDRIKICRNKCRFCFVEQTPPGSRKTMNIKDDDYRLSFLWGNFISMTNFTEEDWRKILEYRLSPLYISVHCTDPALRRDLFRNPAAADIMNQLKRLAEGGIRMHCQIVLCPEYNDGARLTRTLEDLMTLRPAVASVAVVPVGLTKYHKAGMRSFTPEEMEAVIEQLLPVQKAFFDKFGEPVVFLSDEFYIKTGRNIPAAEEYGDFPQIENGIGMMRLFLDDFEESEPKLPEKSEQKREISIVTGKLAEGFLNRIAGRFSRIENISVRVHAVENVFFGKTVDVAGLLAGRDIAETLLKEQAYAQVLLPSVSLNDDNLFLDGYGIEELQETTGKRIVGICGDYGSLERAILGERPSEK